MKLLDGPLWELGEHGEVNLHKDIVRIKLHEDNVVAEFTITELCNFFGIKNADCLKKQFRLWHEIQAFEWDSSNALHLEKKPFQDYFSNSKISNCFFSAPPGVSNHEFVWGIKKLLDSETLEEQE